MLVFTESNGSNAYCSEIPQTLNLIKPNALYPAKFKNSSLKSRHDSFGIDAMSFVQEQDADSMAAYAFSKHWVGRVRI